MAREENGRWLRIMWTGINNLPKMRIYSKKQEKELRRNGFGMTLAEYGLPFTGDFVLGPSPIGLYKVTPDWDTLCTVPYQPSHSLVFADGPSLLSPRYFLRQMIEKLEKDHGVKFLASFEEEFYILRRKTEYSSERKEEAKKSEEGGEERERERREREKREVERDWEVINRACYSNADGLEVSSGLLTEIVAALDDFGVEVEAFHLEGGPGQYEIVWKYTDCLRAADNHILAQQTIKGVAAKQSGKQWGKPGFLKATFCPKPLLEELGSGLHVHFSLEKDGRNLMGDLSKDDSFANGFVAGVLDHLPSLCAIGQASANSFLRSKPECWVGVHQCIGIEHKDCPIRVCGDINAEFDPTRIPESVSNVEIKSADGTSNPYLWLGSIIACGMDGVKRGLSLPPPVPDADFSKQKKLPSSLEDALGHFEKDSVLKEAFGEELSSLYLKLKRSELKDNPSLSFLIEKF